jgi:hypothetical protein
VASLERRGPPTSERQPQRPAVSHTSDPRGEMRRRIVTLLEDYPEGLMPGEIQSLLGVSKSLTDTCLGMVRYGLLQRVGRGRYVAGAL